MSLTQEPPDSAGRKTRSVAQSWEAPVNPALEQADREPAGDVLTLPGLVAFLRRNGKKIGSLMLILFTASIAVLSIFPAHYAATALVFVDPREQHVTADPDVLPGIGQDAAALQSLIEIAKSDGFLRPLIERLKVAEDDDIAGGETNPSKLLDKFRARLDISRRGLTYVVAMTFTSKSPQRAAYYANAVADAFVANQIQTRTGAIEDAAGFLNSRLKALNDQVRAADDAVAAFKAAHKIINAGKESTTGQLRVTELNQQVSAARLLTEEAKNRYEQAQRNLKANIEGPAGSRQDLLSILRAQRSQLNDQIAQKRAVFGDRHPDLLIAYNQLNELDKQIEVERKRNVESAKSDYETLRNQQKSLELQLASLEGEMLADVQASVRLQELQRNADASHNIYEQFLSRFKATSEQRLLQTSQARIVSVSDRSDASDTPFPPDHSRRACARGAAFVSRHCHDDRRGPGPPRCDTAIRRRRRGAGKSRSRRECTGVGSHTQPGSLPRRQAGLEQDDDEKRGSRPAQPSAATAGNNSCHAGTAREGRAGNIRQAGRRREFGCAIPQCRRHRSRDAERADPGRTRPDALRGKERCRRKRMRQGPAF